MGGGTPSVYPLSKMRWSEVFWLKQSTIQGNENKRPCAARLASTAEADKFAGVSQRLLTRAKVFSTKVRAHARAETASAEERAISQEGRPLCPIDSSNFFS